MKTRKLLALLLAVLTAAAVLSGSIAAPILCRSFYYAHIDALALEALTGLPEALIRDAYDQMMDYCTGRSNVFSTGILGWSAEGKAHFDDVRGLFLLDLWMFGLSLAGLAAAGLLCRRTGLRPYRFRKRGAGFWGAVGLGIAFLTVGGLAALDFNRAFILFHTLFFPGKDNWLFDPHTDQIILILPEVFFRNCAILILALLLVCCAVLVLADLRHTGQSTADSSAYPSSETAKSHR